MTGAASDAGRPAWAAVVVSYEPGPLLASCVQSLQADTSAGAVELVVVDNGSTDGSVEALRADPAVTIVDPGRNLGYSGGANLGIARTTADVVAVCNADLLVRPGTAGVMVRRLAAEPDLGAVGPRLRDPDGTHYPSARSFPSVGDAVGHGLVGLVKPDNRYTRRYRELDADPDVARDVDWVSGAAIWLRRAAVDAVGGWDDGYFMYVEDVDLCWRLRVAGWRVSYEPAGEVTHVHGASTARHPYRMIAAHHRSLLRFAAKRWHGWRRVLLAPAALYLGARAGLAMAVQAVRPRSGAAGGTG